MVSNVLNDAAKYTPDGGRIRLAAEAADGQVVLDVTDTGVGIARDMLPKVFDLFAQVEHSLDRARGGLGIGLSLARMLVEMHGGFIAAVSDRPGRGSTFVIGCRSPSMPGHTTRIVVESPKGRRGRARVSTRRRVPRHRHARAQRIRPRAPVAAAAGAGRHSPGGAHRMGRTKPVLPSALAELLERLPGLASGS